MMRVPTCAAFVTGGAALLAATLTTHAVAADASAWAQDQHSAVRLIASSGRSGAGRLRAGVEIRMKPGWKTYWRYPGDSGVPPRFDFSGSTNLASAIVLWPAPHVFKDEAGQSIGYKDTAIFPVAVTPRTKGEPVTLNVKVDYAICEKLCVPAEGKAVLTLDGNSGSQSGSNDAMLAAAEAQVPRPVTAAAAGLTVKRVSDGQKPLVVVDLPAAANGTRTVLVEGPSADWALPVPSPVPDAPAGHSRFSFALDGLPAGADPKAPVQLTFTIVGGDKPIEVKTRLD
jgi:DsbC/DsbD-like thiol-disulfide interchange protein